MNISLICACKNRFDSLIISLNSWLKYEQIKEIIIVDWDSDNDLKNILEIDSRIKVIRVNNQPYFNLSQPLNIAASFATQEYILKVDTDYILNPYYNFFDHYTIDQTAFVSGISLPEKLEYWCEEQGSYNIKYSESSVEELFKYFCAYSPFFKYVKGLLFVSKSNFDSVGGFDESIESYGWEDDNMSERLKLFGLNQIKIENDITVIHIPHSDKKRYLHCKDYDPEIENQYRNNLVDRWSGNDLDWQTEYVVVQDLIKKNKKDNKIDSYYIDRKYQWDIKEHSKNYYIADLMNNRPKTFTVKAKISNKKNNLYKLKEVRYISLEESVDRREELEGEFKKYNVKTIPFISKRFSESDDVITGDNVYQLNDGTKGCCVSHLKMIKDWYENSDDGYGFFCEDDLSLETVQYWNFNWEQFIETIPEDADCVQLLTVREDYETFELRDRMWNDWSATAYILTRDYAKKLIDNHIKGDEYHLYVPDKNIQPLIENIIFCSEGKTYTIPLFVENISFRSTFEGDDDDVNQGQKNNHFIAHEKVLNWWKNMGQVSDINDKKLNVVDCFTYFNEKEIFELRINLLKDYVDKFVVVDANHYHNGLPKEYTLKKLIDELDVPKEKIEVIELDLSQENLPPITEYEMYYGNNIEKNGNYSSRERLQRDAISQCLNTNNFSDDTIFIVGDCDEIINPEYIQLYKNLALEHRDKIFKVPLVQLEGRADMRVYHTNTDTPREWKYSLFVCLKSHMESISLTHVRANFKNPYPIVWAYENDVPMEDLGWHFSWMGSNIDRLKKAEASCHHDQDLSHLKYGNYSEDSMKNFMTNYELTEGQISPSGDVNYTIKNYRVDNLPKIIFDLPRVKEYLLPNKTIIIKDQSKKTEIEELLTKFSLDTENPRHNFNLGLWYEKRKHTAPALSYFLRCAERSADTDKDLAYEALLHASHCYDRQGTRDGSARSLLWQAQMFMPNRPEAYYLLARFAKRKEWWQDCYTNADLCLRYCDFDVKPLETDVEYPGKHAILFEKAISAWWWGKSEESKSLLQKILIDYDLNDDDYAIVCDKLNQFGGEIPENIRRN